jgi:cobalt-zinc-cadmium efflux system membrane fusion protein
MNENTSSGKRTLSRGRQVTIIAVVTVGAVVLLFGVPALTQLMAPKPPPPAAPPPPGTFRPTADQMATLKIVAVQAIGFHPGVETEGKIATDDDHTTQVFSPYSGRVTRVLASAGDVVHAGQPLFAIAASEFVQAQNDLVAAHAQLKLAEAAESRQSALYLINGTALKDWQQSQADLLNAQTALGAVRGRLRILGQTDAQIAALEKRPIGQPVSAETVVASPITGVVLQRSVGVGQNLGSVTNGGTTAAFQISDLSSVWLVGQVREADAPKAKLGQAIEVRVAALPDRVFEAKVNYVAPTVDPVSRRVLVRAVIPNPGGELKPEMFASFSLTTGAGTTHVGAPAEAVIFEGDTARVWVARPGGELELRQIKTGQTQNGLVEVEAGLNPGDRIVTNGALFIDRASKSD